MSTERLDDLEIKMAFQEELVEALNGVVGRQQQEIELLQQQVRYLYRQIRDLRPVDEAAPAPEDEVPPHY
ncbi:SlyX protein [Fluviicoccus keumensis]|uniref:Protein SlyX homolog n=1 Tax=Fluviicoccus keumensis TaxID=1435465 RepID=A0A4Q7ZBX5_9GAMM|nr:SlyX family protein [Fluviicoccus keumensis]RZU47455.1 SlyX protein [Fluviicoccus keumensis]